MTSDVDVRRPVPAWVWGGGLLVASAILPTLSGSIFELAPVTVWASRILFAAAMTVFAFGLRGEGSIVARRTPGVAALLVLGFAVPLIVLVTPSQTDEPDVWMLQVIGNAQLALAGAAALVAVVSIARARVLPGVWRWAPAVGLAVAAAVLVLGLLLGLSAGVNGVQDVAIVLAVGGWIAVTLVPLTLGVAAMVLGGRGLPAAPAQIYPSAG